MIITEIAAEMSTHPYAESTPWLAILKSPAVWSVLIAHIAANWGNYQLNSTMPLYLANILGWVYCL